MKDLQSSKQTRLKDSSRKGGRTTYYQGKTALLLNFDSGLQPVTAFFKKLPYSFLLNRTAPKFEVLIGFKGKQSSAVENIVRELKNKFPNFWIFFLKVHNMLYPIVFILIYSLAKQSSGNYLFFFLQGGSDMSRLVIS